MNNGRHLILLMAILACSFGSFSAMAAKKPNVVFILTDDQGWNALSIPADPNNPASGSTYYRTPRLAEMAKQGMRFSQAYSPAPTCSPSRHSLQWGRSPTSLRVFGADKIGSTPEKRAHMKPEFSLPQMIKKVDSSYVTAHMGKWHICYDGKTLGYDVWDFGEGHRINPKTGLPENNPNSCGPEDPKYVFSLTRKANAFIEEQAKAERPFFIQISHYANHRYYKALVETRKKYETTYAADATEYQKSPLWAAMNENLQLLVGEMKSGGRVMRVMLEEVDGQLQGACVPFLDGNGLNRGCNRLAWARDGSLFIGHTKHTWAGGEGITRVSWDGKMPFEVQRMNLTRTGFRFSFTKPVDRRIATRPETWPFTRYYYRYHGRYGSKQYDLAEVGVKSVTISDDAKTVDVALNEVKAWHIHEVRITGMKAADGTPLANGYLAYTLNRLVENTPPEPIQYEVK